MKTYLDCIPCFFKQALEASRISGAPSELQREILIEVAKAVQTFPLESTPPEMGKIIHTIIKRKVPNGDPYKEIRRETNDLVLSIYPRLKEIVSSSSNRLLKAVELAIYGNVIDYGPNSKDKVERELYKIASQKEIPLVKCQKRFQYKEFVRALTKTKKLLYLADNAGEIVFDKLLIEEIKRVKSDVEITVAVKEVPIINDATIEDAKHCELHKTAKLMSSGSDAPGTILSLCKSEFLEIFDDADMIISKGQGNFESLSDVKKNIFFLLMAKCKVVASHLGCNAGEIILFHRREKGKGG